MPRAEGLLHVPRPDRRSQDDGVLQHGVQATGTVRERVQAGHELQGEEQVHQRVLLYGQVRRGGRHRLRGLHTLF